MNFVIEYSKFELTYDTDKLFAIAGIAKEWQSQLGQELRGQHHLGLFDCTLPEALLWYSGGALLTVHRERAASWSWASTDGLLQFMNIRMAAAFGLFKIESTVQIDNGDEPNYVYRLMGQASVMKVDITAGIVNFGWEKGPDFLRQRGVVIKGCSLNIPNYRAVARAALDDTSTLSRPAYCATVFTLEIVDEDTL